MFCTPSPPFPLFLFLSYTLTSRQLIKFPDSTSSSSRSPWFVLYQHAVYPKLQISSLAIKLQLGGWNANESEKSDPQEPDKMYETRSSGNSSIYLTTCNNSKGVYCIVIKNQM